MFWASYIINKISNKLKNEKGEDKLENYCLKEKISYFNWYPKIKFICKRYANKEKNFGKAVENISR